MNECICHSEITTLNKDTAKFNYLYIYLINPSDEEGAYIRVHDNSSTSMDVVPIYYCPFCGRKL